MSALGQMQACAVQNAILPNFFSHSPRHKSFSKVDIDHPSRYIPDASSPIDCKTMDAPHIENVQSAI